MPGPGAEAPTALRAIRLMVKDDRARRPATVHLVLMVGAFLSRLLEPERFLQEAFVFRVFPNRQDDPVEAARRAAEEDAKYKDVSRRTDATFVGGDPPKS